MSNTEVRRNAWSIPPWLSRPTSDPRARRWLAIAALAACYYASAELGYAFEFSGPVAAVLWLPVGVAIAALYLGGLRLWPGVLIGDLLANDYHTLPIGSALGQTAGNMLEVLTATLLLRGLIRRGSPLDTVGNLGRMLFAFAVAGTVSATVGTLSLRLGGVLATADIPGVWRTWWLGDCSGALVVVPFAVAWVRPPRRAWWRAHGLELGLMVAAVAALSEIALRTHSPATYIVFPALVWAALRFGPRGAALAVVVMAMFTAWNTSHLLGPFVFESLTRSLLNTQLYIGVAAISTLCLAAVVSEREQFAEKLRASRARLVEASDVERHQIERDLHDGAQQRLIALAAHLGIAARRTRESPEEAGTLIEEAGVVLTEAIDELRAIAHGIHPAVLSDLGLARAIRSMAAHSGVPVLVLDLPSDRFDPTAEATAYYVVAEAVANAQSHSHASSISVRAVAARSNLRVEVLDDGVGGASAADGSGLEGLRDRVEALGGTLDIDSLAGCGTRVAAAIPVAVTS